MKSFKLLTQWCLPLSHALSTHYFKKDKDQSLYRKHPWVFSGAIDLVDDELKDGDLVSVLDSKQKLLGIGHFQHATIAVRILSFQDSIIDADFFT